MAQSIVIHTIILFLLSALLVFDCIWILLKTPFVYLFKDKPGMRKIHQQTVPRAGGICVAFSFLVILFFGIIGPPEDSPIVHASLRYFFVHNLVHFSDRFFRRFHDVSYCQ